MSPRRGAVLASALALGLPLGLGAAATPAAELEDVVVSASRTLQRSFDAPAAIQSVDGAQVRAAGPGIGLSESMSRVPGLVVLDRQNHAQDLQVSIRGFGARSSFGIRGLRVIVDGIPATMPDGQGQLSTVVLPAIERIEVLRGPLAQLYGNAAGGVLQVFTREGASPASVGGELYGGSWGTVRGGLSGSARSGAFAGRVDATTFETDGWRAHSAATRRQQDARLSWDAPTGTRVGLVANAFELPRALDPHMDRIGDVLSMLICVALGWYAVGFVQSSAALGERGMAIPIKVWPIQLVLPWMFFSSALRHAAFAIWPALRPEPKGESH